MSERLQRIWSVANLVVVDGMRRHALIGLVVMALLCQGTGLFFFGFIPRDIARASSDFVISVSWLAGMVFVFFHAVQTMAWGEDRRVIHTLLSRPIARSEYVLGIFAGLALLLLMLNLMLGGIGWGVLEIIQKMVSEHYFGQFSVTYFYLTWLGIFLVQLTLLAVIMLFSGLVRGSFTVLLMILAFYLICNGLPVVRQSLMGSQSDVGMQRLLQVITAFFPDFSQVDYKRFVIMGESLPSFSQLCGSYSLLLFYISIALWLACVVYERRDLK